MRRRTRGGKISTAEWPRIQSRYLAGDPLVNIARDYRCTVRLLQGMLKEKTERGSAGAEARVAFYGGPVAGYRIDDVLRRRVTETMVTFLFSFDHVLKENTGRRCRTCRKRRTICYALVPAFALRLS
jgi:hypothetical protein